MKQLLTTLLLFWSINIFAQQTYDIVIVEGAKHFMVRYHDLIMDMAEKSDGSGNGDTV